MSNLLPPQEMNRIKILYRKRFLVVVFRSVMILCLVASVFLLPSYLFSRNEESSLSSLKKLLESRETSELKQSLVSNIYDINTHLDVFHDDYLMYPLTQSFINPILHARIPAIRITNINYSTTPHTTVARVQISGLATNREAILAFGDNLRKQKEITNVDIPINNFIKESNMPFNISLTVLLK